MIGDAVFIFYWWVLFFILGFIGIPISWLFFKRFIDSGYGFSKIISPLVISYTAFLLAITRIATLSTITLYAILVFYFLVNVYIYLKNKTKITAEFKKNSKAIFVSELLFAVGLFFWSFVRGYQPDINGLEKFMDFGFINSILNSQYLPPPDMWFAGESINYYWFGHFYVAMLTKLSTLASSLTYNLMIATILGLSLAFAFSIVSTLIRNLQIKPKKRTAYAAGLISAILLVFAGNFHTPLYALKNGVDNYWYPDATRFIGYNPESSDKTIHEFPIYSFVVSDLHAHLINLPLVLLFIGLLLALTLKLYPRNKTEIKNKDIIKLIPIGLLLGVMFMTNAWDLANYLLLTGVVLIIFNLKLSGIKIKAIWVTFKSILIIILAGFFVVLPFLLNFESLAQGVQLVNNRTPLWQLGVLWGFPAVITVIFALTLAKLKKKIDIPDLFILSLIITSWILIFIPEIVFVKDIYIASHQRANTMFKLTYQAFVMFYLASGYIAVRTLLMIKTKLYKLLAILFFVILFVSILTYPSFAVTSFYADLKNYRGLDGATWLQTKHPEQLDVINWLNKNIDRQSVILEAPGDSYTEFNVISSYTGLPTVSGWYVHEWLWRGDSSFPQKRVADIDEIYTASDLVTTKTLLDKYNVEYVIVGVNERTKYPNLNELKFSQLGKKTFISGDTTIYQIN